jgi:hypothetical protein
MAAKADKESPSDSLPLGTVTTPPRETRRRSARITGYVLGGGLLSAAAVVLVLASSSPDRAPAAEVKPAVLPAPAPAAPALPNKAELAQPVAVTNPAPPATAEPAVPAPSASAEPSGDEGGDLPYNQGYLTVRSSIEADVYATGFKVGKTNTRNPSPCNLRWVRLGSGEPPRWVSPGRTTLVKCRGATSIALEPAEPAAEARGRRSD